MARPPRIVVTLLHAALLAALLSCGGTGGGAGAAAIGADELDRRIREGAAPFILDVRTPEEYAAGHIPGAMLIPHDQLAGRLAELPVRPGDELVVHCKTGGRAGMAEQTLVAAGYTQVRPLEGHMEGWRQGGHPVETAPPQ
jgi:phage shock protein E